MSTLPKSIHVVALAGLLLLTSAIEAHAYIDPGTGSYILQITLAFFLGALFALKMFWKNVKAFLTNIFSRGNKHSAKNR